MTAVLMANGQWSTVSTSMEPQFLEGGGGPGTGGALELIPGPDGMGRTISYRKVYESNPWLWTSIHTVSRGFGRMPAKVYEVDDEGNKTRVRPNADTIEGSLALALRRPGNRTSWQAFQRSTSIDQQVEGSSITIMQRDRRGFYTGLLRIPYNYVRCDNIGGVYRYWDSRKPKATYLGDDILHFGAYSENLLWSPSPIGAMTHTIKLFDAIQRHLVAFFGNSARPSGHVEVDRATSKTQRKLIREAVTSMYAGPENAGKVLITSGKWVPITQNNDHAQIIELIKLVREELVAVVGVPPPMVGLLDRAIMSNVRELRSHYVRDVVGPHVASYEGDLDAQLLAGEPRLAERFTIELEQAAVLQADKEARAALYSDRLHVESLNEIRASENMPKLKDTPEADVPRMPLNEAPVGKTGDETDDEAKLYERPPSKESD